MIDHFGLNVCQPSPAASLKILAAQISDRDSGVRTAALNALVCVYAIVGEPLWKMLGQMPEKERSMLEERIKRSGRPNATTAGASNATPATSKRSASERPTNRKYVSSKFLSSSPWSFYCCVILPLILCRRGTSAR